ncbi:type II toxin-antitoxin system RelE/ParE family toxin [Candidatus Curtissbacteria bacterium]|nr:type II toxin-antitoxin system RelE/ParE family toxin [Candidatus Curtissbacteria bacterium]
MDFKIVYYKDRSGKSPIEEFLLDLAVTNELLFNQTSKGLGKLRNRAYHNEPLSKYLESGLWELRIRSRNDTLRIIYSFMKGQVIILLHVFIKKQQKTPPGELEMARKRLNEIKMRETD